MHELSIAQSIISIAESAIPKDAAATVSAVRIQVGELSGIETESLQFSFSIIKANTILQNAELEIETVEGEAVCNTCNHIFHLRSFGNTCPQCNGYSLHILKGKEMKVMNIVVDE
jgi:hydrogenase nickel incorporation protein HypA/HybF